MGRPNVRTGNGRLAMGVAAVAVLAVAGGAAFAAHRGPVASPSAAARPLAATATPVRSTVKVDLGKLPTGRPPQVAYVSGRTIRGGLGEDVTVPGRQEIIRAVRYDGDALVILEVGMGGSELVRVSKDQGILPGSTPAVASLVTSVNEDAVAYGTARTNADHTSRQGNAVYWRNAFTDNKLDRPEDWASTVLAVVGDTVYFAASTDRDGQTSTLNVWHTQTGQVDLLKSFRSPAVVDFQGTNGVDQISGAAQTFCSAIRELATGSQLWRTCEYSLNGFTPDGRTVIATPDFRGEGGDPSTTAIDSRSGAVRRQWTGVHFLGATAEDDDHLLMVVDTGENTAGAIIRCSIGSGACELATAPTRTPRRDTLRLMGERF
ncbi:hypothetical protein EV138_2795 [Kribbella voronezhensis]|uniref:WD40 repeat protein n=1 Tax=Kribbella voronezhensis TaxID=2512212 RepID=A0A4R7TB39_9ACTN|nr:hypothetical protein [Kribbella voronezhensis]TDU89234.1 hypothetical protein EV138_2795 [Kribbella voronezhensis]